MAFSAMAGHAQVTFNIRAGGGGFQVVDDYGYSSEGVHNLFKSFYPCGAIILESNISKQDKKFTFSPSILVASDFFEALLVEVPLHVGYKVPMGIRSLFIPKVGPMLGYDSYSGAFMCGLSSEFAFEIKHFILAINLQEDLVEKKFGVFGTIGVKF